MRPVPGEDDEKSAYFPKAEDSRGTVPLTTMASRRLVLVAVGSMGSADWRREEACRGRAQELSFFFGPGLECSCLRLYYVSGTLPRSLPGSGFSAWCNNRGRSAARVERVACAAGARHGVSGIFARRREVAQ